MIDLESSSVAMSPQRDLRRLLSPRSVAVVGASDKPGALGASGELDAVVGVVGTGPKDDGGAVSDGFESGFEGGDLFVVGEGGGFAGGAADDDAGVALIVYEVVGDTLEGFDVEVVLGIKRSDHGGQEASPVAGLVHGDRLPLRFCGEMDEDGVHDLLGVEAKAFDDDGVGGEHQGGVAAGVVAVVAADDVHDDLGEDGGFVAGDEFVVASAGAFFDAGGEEDFEVGAGGDDGGDIAAFEDEAAVRDDLLLLGDEAAADGAVFADFAGELADVEGADCAADVFSIEEDGAGLAFGEGDCGAVGEGAEGFDVGFVEACALGSEGDGAIHGAGVEDVEASSFGEQTRDGGFACTGGAINRDCLHEGDFGVWAGGG